MTGHTPTFGIPYPDATTKGKNLPTELQAMAAGVEAALVAASVPPVTPAPVMVAATAAARDAYWGVPATEAARVTLQGRGATTIRTDKGWTERYYATYNASTNPGGATPAGWYPIEGAIPEVNLLPSGNQAVNAGSTITAWSAPGSGGSVLTDSEWFTYSGGVITALRAGRYRIMARASVVNAAGQALAFFLTRNGTSEIITQTTVQTHSTYGTMADLRTDSFPLAAADTVRLYVTAATTPLTAPQAAGRAQGEFSVQFLRPNR
jgi:hypothetical protein